MLQESPQHNSFSLSSTCALDSKIGPTTDALTASYTVSLTLVFVFAEHSMNAFAFISLESVAPSSVVTHASPALRRSILVAV